VTGNYTISNDPSCPTCIQQLIIGVEAVPATCIYDNIPAVCPAFDAGPISTTITAPAIAGTYTIYANNPYDFSCTLGDYSGSSGNNAMAIGTLVVDPNVGIIDNGFMKALTIYPNPGSGMFTIEFSSEVSKDMAIIFTNAMGQELIHENTTVPAGHFTRMIHAEKFAKGIYVLQLSVGDRTVTRKIVIQ